MRARLQTVFPWRRLAAVLRSLLLALVAVVAALAVLRWITGPLAWSIGGQTVQGLTEKDRADAINSVRQVILAGAAGVIALGGLGFTARTFALSRRGQITDRYTAAIALLASEKTAERIGGVFALEHILRESVRDHVTVVEVLTAFVRERAPVERDLTGNSSVGTDRGGAPQPPEDVQAALTVLGRRPIRAEPNEINLRRTQLAGAHLVNARLDGAAMSECDLRGAYLTGAQLRNAALWDSQLQGAYMRGAQLLNADLTGADLHGAAVDWARFGGVWDLIREQLQAVVWDEAPPQVDAKYEEWLIAPGDRPQSSRPDSPLKPGTDHGQI